MHGEQLIGWSLCDSALIDVPRKETGGGGGGQTHHKGPLFFPASSPRHHRNHHQMMITASLQIPNVQENSFWLEMDGISFKYAEISERWASCGDKEEQRPRVEEEAASWVQAACEQALGLQTTQLFSTTNDKSLL